MSGAPRIAIVGGGFTGAAAAVALLRTVDLPFDLVIVEPQDELGGGLAYGTAAPFHLLNVRAGKLGIHHGKPNDFALWARDRSFGIRPPRSEQPEPGRAFLPRPVFGRYVEERLQAAIAERPDVGFTHVQTHATAVRRAGNRYSVELQGAPSLDANSVILATGYGSAPTTGRFGHSLFAALDPSEVKAAASALFVGTGLTFVDQFLLLRSLGFRGEALALSRHALLPEVHRASEAPRPVRTRWGKPDLREYLAVIRDAMVDSEPPAAAAVDIVLGLRERLQTLWQTLDEAEQRRFLRHLRPYWNVVRHRIPPEIHAQLRNALQNREVSIAAGRVQHITGNEVRLRLKGDAEIERRFDFIFDCTGFRPDIGNPVIQSLIRQDLARADAHDLGLAVSGGGEVLAQRGGRSPGLYALGPLTHGTLFEITAIPEIVAQAARMAERLRNDLGAVLGVQFSRRTRFPDYPGMVG